jgi:hypothetical protein
LWFVLQLLLLNPAAIGLQVTREFLTLRSRGALLSPVGLMVGVDSLFRVCLAALGLVCGVLLCTAALRERGPRRAGAPGRRVTTR